MPPTEDADAVPGTANPGGREEESRILVAKPPLPGLSYSRSGAEAVEIQLPHVIGGALVAAFAAALADRLGNDLVTHYYLSDHQRVGVNLDRVLDRLVADFGRRVWDELWDFYYAANPGHARQLSLLFRGPVRQVVLTLTGPELPRCLLDRIGPGLSRRPASWSLASAGVDLALAMQLVCRWWHHEHPSRSPGGSPDDIARTLCARLVAGRACADLLSRIRRTLYTPHHVQSHLMESAVWHVVTRHRAAPPPADGYHVVQLRLECDPRRRILEQGHADIASFPVIAGTADESAPTTVAEYTARHWARCGRAVMRCLREAVETAAESARAGRGFSGMSVWDDADPQATMALGLRLVHVEVDEGLIRLTVSAWVLALVEILQQVAWTCAALGPSPFPEAVAEARLQVMDWHYTNGTICINCSLVHTALAAAASAGGGQGAPGGVIVPGFPIDGDDRVTHDA